MFNLSKKFRICRYYNEDLWGELRFKKELNTTFVYFVRQFKEKKNPLSLFSKSTLRKQSRKSLYGNLISTRKKLSLYYGGLRTDLSRWESSPERMLHLLAQSVIMWEGRLSSVVYRSGFCSSILSAIVLVISGGITVNREVILKPGHPVEVGDIVEVIEPLKKRFYLKIVQRLQAGQAVLISPKYLEISFSTLSSVLIRVPSLEEVYHPFSKVL